MDMDHAIQPQRNNEKDATIKFEVFEHVDSKRLKLVKPVIDEARYFQEYPNVSIIKHSAANSHAMNIMCSMNHKNIVSMKALGPKSQDGYLIFIEECDGSMNSRVWRDFYDAYGHIPSDTFRTIVSEIIEGIEFLRRNRKYHGNLTWKSTLYKHPSSVKLCNFRSYDMVMSRDDAQWQDWMFLRQMLKDVLDVAMKINQDPQREEKLFCDVIDGLIELIGNSDRNSLYRIKDIVLDDVFFWTSGRRTIFIMSTVSGLMLDSSFCEEINSSDICELPWDSHDTNGFLDSDLPSTFSVLLEHCKNYRANLIPQPPELDCNRKADCVKFICASYTHQHQEDIKNICKGRADLIFRRKYPKLFIELNRIVKARPAAVRSLTHPSHTSHRKIVSAN